MYVSGCVDLLLNWLVCLTCLPERQDTELHEPWVCWWQFLWSWDSISHLEKTWHNSWTIWRIICYHSHMVRTVWNRTNEKLQALCIFFLVLKVKLALDENYNWPLKVSGFCDSFNFENVVWLSISRLRFIFVRETEITTFMLQVSDVAISVQNTWNSSAQAYAI